MSVCLLEVTRKPIQVKVKNLFQKLQTSVKCSIFVYVISRVLLCSLFCIIVVDQTVFVLCSLFCIIVVDQTVFVLRASGSRKV